MDSRLSGVKRKEKQQLDFLVDVQHVSLTGALDNDNTLALGHKHAAFKYGHAVAFQALSWRPGS